MIEGAAVLTESDVGARLQVLVDLLTFEQPRWLESRLAEFRAAQAGFARLGYAALARPPKHPLIRSLADFERRKQVKRPDPAIADLIDAANSLATFRRDWQGKEHWLAQRLRDVNGCVNTLFELRTGSQFKSMGHDVQYLAPQEQAGPDLLILSNAGRIYVECVLMDEAAGRRVRDETAEEIARRLARYMRRSGHNRVLSFECRNRLDPRDTDAIVTAVKKVIASNLEGQFEMLEGKYRLELVFGGSEFAPLDWGAARARLSKLQDVPSRFGDVHGLDAGVQPPLGGYVVRGVSVASVEGDNGIEHLIDAAIAKGSQLPDGAPGLIVAGFGAMLSDADARSDQLRLALGHHVPPRLRTHPEVSAIAFHFRAQPHVSQAPSGSGRYIASHTVVHWFPNRAATNPLPNDFRWSHETS